MAELMLFVELKDRPKHRKFDDGDIFEAKNNRKILCDHTQRICNIKRVGFKSNGLRDVESLPFQMALLTSQYRFDRVSQYEVLRTDLFTNEQQKFGLPEIDVPLYLKRRLNHDRHKIYGETGSEIWFGGKTDSSQTKLNQVWNEIEERTERRRNQYQESRPNPSMLKKYMFVETEDFDDERAGILVSPLVNPELELDDPEYQIKERKHNVRYKDLSIVKGKDLQDIRDIRKPTDFRKKKRFKEIDICEEKVM
jgi:hypothetical protein